MIEPGQHPPDFTVLTFAQDDAQPRTITLFLEPTCGGRFDVPFSEKHAGEQLLNVLGVGGTGHENIITFRDPEARVHQFMGEVTIVGEQ